MRKYKIRLKGIILYNSMKKIEVVYLEKGLVIHRTLLLPEGMSEFDLIKKKLNLLFAYGFKSLNTLKVFIQSNECFTLFERNKKLGGNQTRLYFVREDEELVNSGVDSEDLLNLFSKRFKVKIISDAGGEKACIKFFNQNLLLSQYKNFYDRFLGRNSRRNIYSAIMLVEKITNIVRKKSDAPLLINVDLLGQVKTLINSTPYFQYFTQGAFTKREITKLDIQSNYQDIFFYDLNSRYRYGLKYISFGRGKLYGTKKDYNFLVDVHIQHCPKLLNKFTERFGIDINDLDKLTLEQVLLFKKEFPDLYSPYYCTQGDKTMRIIHKKPIERIIMVNEVEYMKKHGYSVKVLGGWNVSKFTDFGNSLVEQVENIEKKLAPLDEFGLKAVTPKAISKRIINLFVGNSAKSKFNNKDINEELRLDAKKKEYYELTGKKMPKKEISDKIKLRVKKSNFFVFYQIVSFSRMRIHEKIISLLKKGEHVFYSRTDSIVTTANFQKENDPDFGSDIGRFKLEYPKLLNIAIKAHNNYLVQYLDKNGDIKLSVKGGGTEHSINSSFKNWSENPSRSWISNNSNFFQDSVPRVSNTKDFLTKKPTEDIFNFQPIIYRFYFAGSQIQKVKRPLGYPAYWLAKTRIEQDKLDKLLSYLKGKNMLIMWFSGSWYCIKTIDNVVWFETSNYFWVLFQHYRITYLKSQDLDETTFSSILPGFNFDNFGSLNQENASLKNRPVDCLDIVFLLQNKYKFLPKSYAEYSLQRRYKRRFYFRHKCRGRLYSVWEKKKLMYRKKRGRKMV